MTSWQEYHQYALENGAMDDHEPPTQASPDDEIAYGEDLEALGFTGGNDEPDTDVYDKQLGFGGGGPLVRVWLRYNRGELEKSGMSLQWEYRLPTGKIGLSYSLRDNPTVGDVKRLLAELDPK